VGDKTVVKQQSYCLLESWQLKRFLDASIYPLLAWAAQHGKFVPPPGMNRRGKQYGTNQNDAKLLRRQRYYEWKGRSILQRGRQTKA